MMRLYSCDNPAHRAAAELLPWYANQSLDRNEAELVESHLAECLACDQELADLRRLHAALVEHDADAAEGLSRIRGRLEQKPKRRQFGSWFEPMVDQWRHAGPWMRRAIFAEAILLAVFAAFGYVTTELQRSDVNYYRVLGSQSSADRDLAEIVVVFDPARPAGDMEGAISRVRGKIIAGPSASGAYTLQLPAIDLDTSLQKLQHDPAVRLAAPVIR